MSEDNQVRALAVSYHALLESIAEGNFDAANTWGLHLGESTTRDWCCADPAVYGRVLDDPQEGSMRPHALFNIWRPDEVAECLEGVKDELYSALWKLTPLYAKRDRELDYECPPDPDFNCLAGFWDKLSDDHKTILNQLAEAHDKLRAFPVDRWS